MNITRRFFLGGAASFGAFGGCRFMPFAGCDSDKPNLSFGVVSDIHILNSCIKPGELVPNTSSDWRSNRTFIHTLEWFRDQGVDAVMVVGDMADNGMVEQLQAVADAWYHVFPDDHAPDGRKVERLFVLGNHDYHGYLYGQHAAKKYPDELERRKHVLRADIPGFWKQLFHEDYARFYRKDVKGYTFLGQHWDDGKGMETGYGSCDFGAELQSFLDVSGKSLDPGLPFFYFQHPHPKDTCYGSWAWGHDRGKSTKALSAYSNAVAFSGHSHYSLTDERSIWQGAFTSVGTSSLRYTGMPYDARLPHGYENTGTEGKAAAAENARKVMAGYPAVGDCRQGMLWRVFDDHITIRRREFLSDLDVGCDWVMPLPVAEARPFAFALRKRVGNPPAFAPDATIVLERLSAKTRKAPGFESVAKPSVKLMIPHALEQGNVRVYEYEVTAEAKDGKSATFYVLAEGFNHALAHKRGKGVTPFVVACDQLPKDTVRFVVRPLDCWWRKGEGLSVAL